MVGKEERLKTPAGPPIKMAIDCLRSLVRNKSSVVMISSSTVDCMTESGRELVKRFNDLYPDPNVKLHSFDIFTCLDRQYDGGFVALAIGDKFSFGLDSVGRTLDWVQQKKKLR